MFCYQCEQTAGNKGCTITGICGKNPDTDALHHPVRVECVGEKFSFKAIGEAEQDL